MRRLKSWFQLLKSSAVAMSDDQTMMMGAALAYYTMFSIAPLLIIAIGIAGVVFGHKASTEVFGTIRGLVGPRGAAAIQSMVTAAADQPRAGVVSTAIGAATLILGASGVFTQLQQSLNIIWKVATSPKAGWWALIRQRLLSFGMVAAMGFILVVSMLVSAGLSAAGTWAAGALPGGKALWRIVNVLVSLGIIGLLFSAVLKLLPDVRLSWRDVSVGGLVTAALFAAGKAAIGAYLGSAAVMSSYGAAGSLVVVLLWTFYSSQILFFGAEFTRSYALRDGRRVQPKEGSVFTQTPFNAAAAAENAVERRRMVKAR